MYFLQIEKSEKNNNFTKQEVMCFSLLANHHQQLKTQRLQFNITLNEGKQHVQLIDH